MLRTFVEMQTMTYNPPTAQVTQQKDVTYGNVQPNIKATKKKTEPSGKKTQIIINPTKKDCQEHRTMRFSDYLKLDEKKDDSYLETDMEKRRKNNEKAIEDMKKTKANKDMVATVRKQFEETEIEEAKQTFPIKKVQKQMEKARKGSVYGRPASKDAVPNVSDSEKKETSRFSKMHHAVEKAKREKQNADKARRSPTFYKDTHPASAPKMKKANESLSFAEFMEARRMDKEGVDRGDSRRAERAEKAKESLAKAQKQKKIWQKHHDTETAKGRTPRSSRDTPTMPEREHKKNHPGSRQAPKERGAKETSSETHNRRVNRHNQRLIKHGPTTKEKKASAGYAAYERDYKKSYGQHKSAWD